MDSLKLEGEQPDTVCSDEIVVCWESEMGDSDLEAELEAVSDNVIMGEHFLCNTGFELETTLAVLITAGCCCLVAELTYK